MMHHSTNLMNCSFVHKIASQSVHAILLFCGYTASQDIERNENCYWSTEQNIRNQGAELF